MIVFWVMSLGLLAWTLGCYACCVLVVTSPIGALIIRGRASARGIGGGARTGAWYWASGFVPWVCYLYLVNGRPLPARLLNFSFRLMIVVWLIGPVIGGGFASGSAPGPYNQWMLLIPGVNLGMIVLAVGWRSVAGRTGPQDVRLRGGDAVPFLFGVTRNALFAAAGISHAADSVAHDILRIADVPVIFSRCTPRTTLMPWT